METMQLRDAAMQRLQEFVYLLLWRLWSSLFFIHCHDQAGKQAWFGGKAVLSHLRGFSVGFSRPISVSKQQKLFSQRHWIMAIYETFARIKQTWHHCGVLTHTIMEYGLNPDYANKPRIYVKVKAAQLIQAAGLGVLVLWITSYSPCGVDGKVFATQMSPRVVETQYGHLRGVLVTLPNNRLPQVEAYLGLQYASIMGNDLRFMPPTGPLDKWDGIRVALKFRPVCPQRKPDIDAMKRELPLGRVDHISRLLPFLENQAEECLNLNVYVPVLRK